MYRCAALVPGLILLVLVGSWSPPARSESRTTSNYKSPLGLVVDPEGTRAYVALHTAGAVAVVDLVNGRVLREIPVGRGPCDVVRSRQGIYVSCEGDDLVAVIDPRTGAVTRRIAVGQAPCGLAAEPDKGLVYVVCRDSAEVRRLDEATGTVQAEPLPISPALLRAAPFLNWSNFLFQGADAPVLGAEVRPSRNERRVETRLLPGAGNLRGLGVCLDLALVAHQRPKFQIPATQISQGWIFTNAVTFLETNPLLFASARPSLPAILDEPQRGYADPSDVVFLPAGDKAFIACAGADSVLLLDRAKWVQWEKAHEGPKKVYYNGTVITLESSDDLAASRHYVTARIPVQANPRRLALSGDGKTLVVSNHLADSLSVLDTNALEVVRTIPLGGPAPDAARRGEILFHANKMTFQGQFTCASCHPDGGSDGLQWDLTRDGVGNFKNTKSLRGVKDTAPYGWEGGSPTLTDRVAGTLRSLHRHEPEGDEVQDLVAYLESLPAPRPLPSKEAEKGRVARGQALFRGKGECSNCHRRAALDDDKPHNVGTRGPTDTTDRFDTPALRGAARSAPYLHDGRAATLEEVFTRHNPGQIHGAAHRLTRSEMEDLIAYLKSL